MHNFLMSQSKACHGHCRGGSLNTTCDIEGYLFLCNREVLVLQGGGEGEKGGTCAIERFLYL